MAPKPLIDLDTLDLEHQQAGREGIRRYNPQRYEFEQLDGIVHYDPAEGTVVGFKDVREDEFWVRGHIPGRPLLPGVLMCEAAAQACSYFYTRTTGTDRLWGFGGLDNVKFRIPVVPGDRLYVLARNKQMGRRRAIFDTQGVVDGKVVFQAVVTGIAM